MIQHTPTGRRFVSVGYTLNDAIAELKFEPSGVIATQVGRNRRTQTIYELGPGTRAPWSHEPLDFDEEE